MLCPELVLSCFETARVGSIVEYSGEIRMYSVLKEVDIFYTDQIWFGGAEILMFQSCFPPVCTQLLVSRPDEENISSYLQLLEKCLAHEVSVEITALWQWCTFLYSITPAQMILLKPG